MPRHGIAGRAVPLGREGLVSKQEDTRERVLDLMESLEVGQPIPAERQLAIER